jgi:SAM-dependent methyltransferase
MSGKSQHNLRETFEQVPELYDRARPSYPVEIFDDLVELAQLRQSARILEIGCGTGQATLPLAERGYEITCIELGEQLAAVARRRLSRFAGVEVVKADFETWRAPLGDFDAVVAFTAFHWIDPRLRYEKSASLLGDGGVLAVVTTAHVLPPGGDDFFVEVQEDYETVLPDDASTKAGAPLHPDAIQDLSEEIAASGFFRNIAARRYLWDVRYGADDYIALLETYSDHRALETATRKRLFDLIRHRIESRPGRNVRKTYLALLNVAERFSVEATAAPT